MRKILLIGLLLTLLLTACGGSKEPTKGDIIVYVTVPLSGFQANGGQTVVGGLQRDGHRRARRRADVLVFGDRRPRPGGRLGKRRCSDPPQGGATGPA